MTWTAEHGWAVLVGIASVLIVVLSGSSSWQLTGTMLHHEAHIALPTLAFVIFSGGVLRDVRRNGWPSFSWRL